MTEATSNNTPFYKRRALFILLILVLCLLGLSAIHQTYNPSVSTKDVSPILAGDNVLASAKIVSVSIASDPFCPSAIVPNVGSSASPVYLIPNGDKYTVVVSANSDGLGLAPPQTVVSCFTAPSCPACALVTPTITVDATVQDTFEQT